MSDDLYDEWDAGLRQLLVACWSKGPNCILTTRSRMTRWTLCPAGQAAPCSKAG